MGLFTTVAVEPTGPSAAGLPTFTPSVPLPAGYEHRWRLTGTETDGAVMTSWVSTVGVNKEMKTATPGTADQGGIVGTSGGLKAVTFPGSPRALRVLNTEPFTTPQRTIAMVVRIVAADGVNTSLLGQYGDDIQILRNADNQMGIFAPGAAAGVSTMTETGNAWRVIVIRLGASGTATAQVWRDGTKVAWADSTGGGLVDMRIPVAGGQFGNIAVRDIVCYPTALSDADLGTLTTQLQATYF